MGNDLRSELSRHWLGYTLALVVLAGLIALFALRLAGGNATAILSRAWPYLLLAAALFGACAYALAQWQIARLARRVHGLLEQLRASQDPAELAAWAQAHPIREIGELARLHAEVRRAGQCAVDHERRTLAYLAHELRAPLQSARSSLQLLRDGRDHPAARRRLQRAVDRLGRAGTTLLWLAGDARPGGLDRTPVATVLGELVDEFAPQAEARQQVIVLEGSPLARWALPRDAVETVLANLLLDAMQCGGPGTVRVVFGAESLAISSPAVADAASPTDGLGLEIARQLVERWGWKLLRDAGPAVVARRRIKLVAARREGV